MSDDAQYLRLLCLAVEVGIKEWLTICRTVDIHTQVRET